VTRRVCSRLDVVITTIAGSIAFGAMDNIVRDLLIMGPLFGVVYVYINFLLTSVIS
jgi:hypothetical protein